jgi:hypothetical protein
MTRHTLANRAIVTASLPVLYAIKREAFENVRIDTIIAVSKKREKQTNTTQ